MNLIFKCKLLFLFNAFFQELGGLDSRVKPRQLFSLLKLQLSVLTSATRVIRFLSAILGVWQLLSGLQANRKHSFLIPQEVWINAVLARLILCPRGVSVRLPLCWRGLKSAPPTAHTLAALLQMSPVNRWTCQGTRWDNGSLHSPHTLAQARPHVAESPLFPNFDKSVA